MLRFFLLLVIAQLQGAVHYTYSAVDPARPARTEITEVCTPGQREYTTYLKTAEDVTVNRMVVDASGNTYIAGRLLADPFIAKLDVSGCLVFTARISTDGYDEASDLAVDGSGRIYAVGPTGGTDFPTRNPMPLSPERWAYRAGFILRLSADGSQLLSSTYLDGTVTAITLDADSNIYVTGQTNSPEFPDSLRLSALRPSMGMVAIGAAFIAKLSPSADRFLFSGYIAGSEAQCGVGSGCQTQRPRQTSGIAIALDRDKNVIIAGNTNIIDLPVTHNAIVPKGIGGFAGKVSADGSKLLYLTYFGARNDFSSPLARPANLVSHLAIDSDGSAIIVGRTYDEKFPATAGTVQPAYSGPVLPPSTGDLPQSDAFAAKLSATGALVWASFLGVREISESAQSVSIASGTIWISGTNHPAAGIADAGLRFSHRLKRLWNCEGLPRTASFGMGVHLDYRSQWAGA